MPSSDFAAGSQPSRFKIVSSADAATSNLKNFPHTLPSARAASKPILPRKTERNTEEPQETAVQPPERIDRAAFRRRPIRLINTKSPFYEVNRSLGWYLESGEPEQVRKHVDLLLVSPDRRWWRPCDDLGYACRFDDELSLVSCAVDSPPRLHSLGVLYPGFRHPLAMAVVEITDDIIAEFSQDLEPPFVFP